MGMRIMEEIFLIGMIIAGSAIAVPTVLLGLLSLFEGFPRVKIGQIAGLVAVAAWVFGLFTIGHSGEMEVFLFVSLLLVLLLFFGLWRREFRLLMLRRDDEFPGRLDKIGWFLMLTLAAPAGA
jgi:nicotinamide riboside transporter PnuC